MKRILLTFLTWRLLLFIPVVLGSSLISYRIGYDYTNIWKFAEPYLPVSNPFLFPWANFDGVHYLSIAGYGYSNDQGFFPLYPLLIRFFATVFGGGETFGFAYFMSGFLIANIAFLLALFILNKLITLDFPKKIAWKSITFLLVFPTSFFFGSLYTESLFLLLALLSFYFARKKKWFLAGIFGMLLSATRLVGIAILPALIYEFVKEEKKLRVKALSLLLPPLGLLSYALYNFWQFGNSFLFIAAHENINPTRSVNSVILIPQTVFRYIKILATTLGQYEWWIALLEISSFIFAATLLYAAWKKKIRLSYIIFAVLCLLVPASSGTLSGFPRYTLIAFPIFISLALIKNMPVKIIYTAVSIVILFLLLAFFARGYFIA
ncbi:MAG: hypothetical protein WD992_00845 [Candidatus Levyibacteriota bacterium]